MTGQGESQRRAAESRALAAADAEALDLRIEEVRSRLPELRAGAGPGRRAAAAVAGSRLWHGITIVRQGRMGRRRAALYRLTRRARVYERGLDGMLAGRSLARPRRPRRPVRHRQLLDGRVLHLDPSWRGRAASAVLGARMQASEAPFVLVGDAPSEMDLRNGLARMDEAADLGAIGVAGWSFDWRDGAPVPVPSSAGQSGPVTAGSWMLVRRSALGDWMPHPHEDPRGWGIDLSLGLRTGGWRTEALPGSRDTSAGPGDLEWWRPVASRWGALLTARILGDLATGGGRWCARSLRVQTDLGLPPQAHEAISAVGWSAVADRAGADVRLALAHPDTLTLELAWPGEARPVSIGPVDLLERSRSAELARAVRDSLARPTWVLTIGSRDARAGEAGGDVHLARALAGEMAGRGAHTVIRTREHEAEHSAPAPSIRLTLRGRAQHHPVEGQLSLLWLISHPDEVSDAELAGHDALMVASGPHADLLTERGLTAETVLQFADPGMFAPPLGAAAQRPLAFVGNWRRVYRRAVWFAHAAGLRPALVGQGWRYLAPEDEVEADAIRHDELPAYYAGTQVLLVDHWDDMRARGFIANRVFDGMAAGCAVVSDAVAGIEEELPGAVAVYRTPEDLAALVRAESARSPEERLRAAQARRELAARRHTCAHRVDQIERVAERAIDAATRRLVSHLAARGAA